MFGQPAGDLLEGGDVGGQALGRVFALRRALRVGGGVPLRLIRDAAKRRTRLFL